MNQFSFNLDQNYLQHDKFGAHYSKNWDKKKQDEYNAWYYKTHKDKWKEMNEEKLRIARKDKDDIRFYSDLAALERKEGLAGDKGHYPGYASDQKRKSRHNKQRVRDIMDTSQIRYKEDNVYSKRDFDLLDKDLDRHEDSLLKIEDIRMNNLRDKLKGINMVKFDIDRAKKKVSSALNKLKNIKL